MGEMELREIISLLAIGFVCGLLICACIAIDRAGGEQDNEKH